jgi:TM2 domain-containing membrane protein YozV
MKKMLLFLLGCALSIVTSAQINSMDISKDTVVTREVVKPIVQDKSVFPDSMQRIQPQPSFHKKHRLVAALLTFPLGIFGLHRIYMHTSSGVPLVYIATFGGLFGVLPFIDFILILLSKDIHLAYTSNPHIFMWQKREVVKSLK